MFWARVFIQTSHSDSYHILVDPFCKPLGHDVPAIGHLNGLAIQQIVSPTHLCHMPNVKICGLPCLVCILTSSPCVRWPIGHGIAESQMKQTEIYQLPDQNAFFLLRKLPREAAKRLELLRNTNQYNLEREMYEVYTDMLRRNEEIGMSDLDLQGPTSFHTRMDTIRPKVSQLSIMAATI